MTYRRRKTLSEEDLKLWEMVKQSTTPLHRASPVVPPHGLGAGAADKGKAAKPGPSPAKPNPAPLSFKLPGRPEPRLRLDLAPDPMQPLPSSPGVLDRRTHDQLRKGKKAPEARIDLHGMTAAQAHGALRGFIRSCHGRGLRLVLVITGKGNTRREEIGIMPTRAGVLRHALPQWLGAPDMQPMILQISAAHIRHGGSGAYYVYLRKKGRGS